jgi:hypothetical protein
MEMTVNLSKECVLILEELVKSGIYGESSEAIAERFVEYGVQGYVDRPSFSIPLLIKEDRLRRLDTKEEKLQALRDPIPGPYPTYVDRPINESKGS